MSIADIKKEIESVYNDINRKFYLELITNPNAWRLSSSSFPHNVFRDELTIESLCGSYSMRIEGDFVVVRFDYKDIISEKFKTVRRKFFSRKEERIESQLYDNFHIILEHIIEKKLEQSYERLLNELQTKFEQCSNKG